MPLLREEGQAAVLTLLSKGTGKSVLYAQSLRLNETSTGLRRRLSWNVPLLAITFTDKLSAVYLP